MLIRKAHIGAGVLALSLLFGGPAATITYADPPDQVARQATVGNVIAALNNVNVQIRHLEALNDLTVQNIRVVNIEEAFNDNHVRILNRALNRNEVNVGILQDFLNESLNDNEVTITDVLTNFLNNNDIDIDDVVAINVLSDGTVIVFYQQD